MKQICIDGRRIGEGHSPYIIAELSANHNQKIENAFELIVAAKRAGADAVKLQTYRADTITIQSDRPEFRIEGGLWDGKTLYELYEWAHTPWEWHKSLFDKANEVGITLFSTPFDTSAVDLLEDLNTPAYKIASFEAIDIPLIRYVCKTGKPVIISTGMADENEIFEAVENARDAGCKQLAILHCVSGYPTPAEDCNLKTITDMEDRFNVLSGLSDHTLDNAAAIAAIALGASIIEKHVTLDRSAGGPDDSFSLEPDELKQLCDASRTAWKALGSVCYERQKSEKSNIGFRRSLYFVRDIEAGETICTEHVRSIRPGYGILPKYLDKVIGKTATKTTSKGTPVTMDSFS